MPDLTNLSTAELLALVKSCDDNALLWNPRQRAIWREIAQRGGI